MADVFSRQKRSTVMSLTRGRGNAATELRLISLLRAHRVTGWRRGSTLPGRPDFVFARAVTRTLRARGWRVLRIWQHALRPRRALGLS